MTDPFKCERQIRAHMKTVSWDVEVCESFLPLFCHAMIDLVYSHISYHNFHVTAFFAEVGASHTCASQKQV